jgi:type I restriction enzyme S subunit
MKQGWEIKRIDDACEVEYGTRVVNKRDGGTIYPVYGGGGATFFMDTYNRENCFIVSRFAMSEQCTRFVKDKFFLNDSGLSVKPKSTKEILQDFLNLQMLYLNDHIYSLARGTAQKNLDVPAFRNIQIAYPKSISEQQRIVSILDEAFAAIAKAKANAEQNLRNAKELFESYLQGVFENGSWERKKWGELCEFVRGPFGGSLKKNIFKEEGYVVYEQKHAIHDHFNQLRYFIDEEKFNEMKRFELFPGDIIMSCSGVTLGRVAIVPDGIKKGIINQALLKLTPKKNVSVHFLKHWLRSNIFQKIIFDYSGGAAIPNVPSAKILKDIKIPFPKLKDQERIVNEIETVLNETKRLEAIYHQKINNLDELKKSILQKAFSGELVTNKTILI